MKKKTVSGVTALTMLASATIPVYAAPIEEGVNTKGLNNPIITAKSAVDPMNVYTSFAETVNSNSGDGSIQNPYNRFEDAIAQVANGGTIYIKADKGAFLNDVGQNLPFLIDKNVTIKPVDGANNAILSVRSAGIILGADVKFENVTLNFANKYHDSIFANGYKLDLINVTRDDGSREIDLFAGGLYKLDGTPIHTSGNNGVINIETNDNFGGGELKSKFGNIYAGSMNGAFNGSAEINVSRKGTYKKLDIGAIKVSGALEADAGNMFDLEEPLPPSENPERYPVMGNVAVNLDDYQISVDGTTGSDAKTNVTTSTVYPNELPLKNVNHLTVKDGHITATYEESNEGTITIPNVTLENGATLDLTKAGKEVAIENYNGNGITMLRKDGKLNITNSMNGSIELQTEGAFNGTSGLVEQDHVYITTPNEDADITFTPHATQTYLELVGNKTDTVVEWKIQEVEESTGLAQINGFVIEDTDAKQVKKYDEINKPNDMGGMDYEAVKFPFKALTDLDPDDLDAWVDLNEYPFEITVNGNKAEYREDKGGIGTYYFVKDLELAFYFTSETYFDEHNLAVIGYTKDGNLAPIKEGEYEIHVSHDKNDGTSAEFTSYLTVTNGAEPPTEDVKPEQPPVNGGGAVQPPVENVPTNGIENLKDLDKKLQEKVDSIIAEVVVAEGSLSLNITGDNEDIAHVKEIEVTEEGIFAIVDGKKLKFGVALDGLKLDLTNTRAIRIDESNKYSAVPHQNTKGGLKVSSDNLENILITSKEKEPFVDVNDSDWFKVDVEEAFNYGFTTGTTATTYNPYADITRAQFAVMIARALELKPASQNIELKDVKGQWYQNEAQALYEAGIIKGFGDGTFGGGKKLTRQQAVAMLGRMLEYVGVDTKVEDDVKFADMDKIGEHAQQSVKFLASNGVLVSGENTKFNPYNNLTRAQMAKMLVRSLRLTDLY